MCFQPNLLFDEIDPEPLGAASLAQVHRARLKDGTMVAVKVQHPYVQGNSLVDMKTMEVSFSHKYSHFVPNLLLLYTVHYTQHVIVYRVAALVRFQLYYLQCLIQPPHG